MVQSGQIHADELYYGFRSSGMLRGISWYLDTTVLGQPIGTVPLEMGPTGCSEMFVTKHQPTPHYIQNSEGLTYTAADA